MMETMDPRCQTAKGALHSVRALWLACAAGLLGACDPYVIGEMNVDRLRQQFAVGTPYADVTRALFREGYRLGAPTAGPAIDTSIWDRCLTRNVSYLPLALAGGQRWVCMNVDSSEIVTKIEADQFVWGL
jgi:hypothetical protein